MDMSGSARALKISCRIGKLAYRIVRRTARHRHPKRHLTKSNIDVRFYDLKGPAGLWAGWFDFATSRVAPQQPALQFQRRMDTRSDCATTSRVAGA